MCVKGNCLGLSSGSGGKEENHGSPQYVACTDRDSRWKPPDVLELLHFESLHSEFKRYCSRKEDLFGDHVRPSVRFGPGVNK